MLTKGQMTKELKKMGIRKGDKNGKLVSLEHLKTFQVAKLYYNAIDKSSINDFWKTKLPDINFRNAVSFRPIDFYELLNIPASILEKGFSLCSNDIKIDSRVVYDPNAEFEYYTYSSCVHDGTLSFITEEILRVLEKVIKAGTYDKRKKPPANNSSIEYTIGDLFVINETLPYPINENKPWLREQTTVYLPLKYETK